MIPRQGAERNYGARSHEHPRRRCSASTNCRKLCWNPDSPQAECRLDLVLGYSCGGHKEKRSSFGELLYLRVFADIEAIPRNYIATITGELEKELSETRRS